jgi:antitoxin VapB
VLISTKDPWYNLYKGLDMFSDDFMMTREQPPLEEREPFD